MPFRQTVAGVALAAAPARLEAGDTQVALDVAFPSEGRGSLLAACYPPASMDRWLARIFGQNG